jgi:hypothetical protein
MLVSLPRAGENAGNGNPQPDGKVIPCELGWCLLTIPRLSN